ncbi:MAG: hypothetical protein JSS42_15920 [Proteobacteria bacterium]|uniref:hypothetical protein n=1 Tax=Rudaea sp. TaxID=2136325 RepID=UPI00321F8CD7|nr:hypothetical protein [Pseudomonadota bacterium]
MNLSTHIHRGLVALALCAAVSAYAASRPIVSVGAPQEMQMLGTITVTAPRDDVDDGVVYTQVQGVARVTVGEPITLGPKEPLAQLAMR